MLRLMVGLFDVDMRTINEYLSNVDNPAELERETTVRKTLTVRSEDSHRVTRVPPTRGSRQNPAERHAATWQLSQRPLLLLLLGTDRKRLLVRVGTRQCQGLSLLVP